MALTYPLSLAQFFETLPFAEGSQLFLPPNLAYNQTAGGDRSSYSLGRRLWVGKAVLPPLYHARAEALEAMISALSEPGAEFLARHPFRIGTFADPMGAILGAASPTLQAVAANNKDVTIQNLPAGYQLSAGDLLSFLIGTRRIFSRVVVGGQASAAGVLTVEVTPTVLPGWSAGVAVSLRKPTFRATLDPINLQYANLNTLIAAGLSFTFTQTMRA